MQKQQKSIAPGHYADFVVLGENPFQTASAQIKDIPILQTWLEGEKVYTKPSLL